MALGPCCLNLEALRSLVPTPEAWGWGFRGLDPAGLLILGVWIANFFLQPQVNFLLREGRWELGPAITFLELLTEALWGVCKLSRMAQARMGSSSSSLGEVDLSTGAGGV